MFRFLRLIERNADDKSNRSDERESFREVTEQEVDDARRDEQQEHRLPYNLEGDVEKCGRLGGGKLVRTVCRQGSSQTRVTIPKVKKIACQPKL